MVFVFYSRLDDVLMVPMADFKKQPNTNQLKPSLRGYSRTEENFEGCSCSSHQSKNMVCPNVIVVLPHQGAAQVVSLPSSPYLEHPKP